MPGRAEAQRKIAERQKEKAAVERAEKKALMKRIADLEKNVKTLAATMQTNDTTLGKRIAALEAWRKA